MGDGIGHGLMASDENEMGDGMDVGRFEIWRGVEYRTMVR